MLSTAQYTPSAHASSRSPARKRLHTESDPVPNCKRPRRCSELEFEEILEEANVIREELELLILVSSDLCQDLGADPAVVQDYAKSLRAIDGLLASTAQLTERQVLEVVQSMIAMTQYLCHTHYHDFALIEMQDELRACRDHVMRFVCQYASILGLSH